VIKKDVLEELDQATFGEYDFGGIPIEKALDTINNVERFIKLECTCRDWKAMSSRPTYQLHLRE